MLLKLEELESHVQEAIVKFSKERGLKRKDLKVKVETGSKKNLNFHGDIFRATLQDGDRDIHIILKVGLPNLVYTDSSLLFGNEINFYTQLFPTLKKLYEDKIGGEFVTVPEYLGHSYEPHKELIILEDMCRKGYVVPDPSKGLTKQESFLVLSKLAKYHAASEALRQEDREEFDRISKKIQAYLPELEGLEEAAVEAYSEDTISEAKELVTGRLPQDVAKAAIAYLDGYPRHFKDFVPKDTPRNSGLPLTVLLFGDCWISNLLFKYDNDGIPLDVCFLDFQMTRVSSPVLDLMELLLMSARGEDLIGGLPKMIDYYEGELARNVKLMGGYLQEGVFRDHLSEYAVYAVFKVFLLFPRMFAGDAEDDKKEASNSALMQVDLKALYRNQLAQQCILDAVAASVKHGFIKS